MEAKILNTRQEQKAFEAPGQLSRGGGKHRSGSVTTHPVEGKSWCCVKWSGFGYTEMKEPIRGLHS